MKENMKTIYVVKMFINGEWRVWNRYEDCCGLSAKNRAELGLKTALHYGKCKIEVELC